MLLFLLIRKIHECDSFSKIVIQSGEQNQRKKQKPYSLEIWGWFYFVNFTFLARLSPESNITGRPP